MIQIRFTLFSLLVIFFTSNFVCNAQNGVWTWLHGTDTANSYGNYGVKGMPADSNMPGGYYEGAYWTDKHGNFWLFGGLYLSGLTNHLWKYNSQTNQWTWMNGPQGIADQNGEWGVQGIPSPLNYPSARAYGPNCWTDNNGDLWIYGGYGFDVNGDQGGLSDLWKYDVTANEWTWIYGSNIRNVAPIYGVIGVASPQNNPGARQECKSGWVDDNNNLWMFGGQDGTTANIAIHSRNDLWKYEISNNVWTWMKGDNSINTTGSFGILGVENPSNLPPSRMSYTKWTGIDSNFYIFGGGIISDSYNDVWKYNLQSNNWTWISGSNLLNDTGFYSIKCNPNNVDFPHARIENSTIQFGESKSHLLWSFGGFQKMDTANAFNDLWIYNMNNKNWTWVSGYNHTVLNSVGNYGVKGIPSPSNVIPSRGGACIWKDQDNNLYVMGGLSPDSSIVVPGNPFGMALKNDLWRFTPDTNCFWEPLLNTNVKDVNAENLFELYPNPSNGKFSLTSEANFYHVQIIIRNSIGVEMYHRVNQQGKSFNFDITTYPPGIYFVQLIEKKNSHNFKLLKQ
ncbi:MAG: T9SS type A sorting domain-containing protein [Bacteroidetes bacterium]|nr:T9SS type A sorting domain-containing protein [Bacteroidota bacterium]MBK8143710.1 T9SS type A sorting domain-containing protein [Bacteroidota bacterium]MBP6315611.1 T9SS type A sorting domain-containing protein [Chitinophagaceae bacterium]